MSSDCEFSDHENEHEQPTAVISDKNRGDKIMVLYNKVRDYCDNNGLPMFNKIDTAQTLLSWFE